MTTTPAAPREVRPCTEEILSPVAEALRREDERDARMNAALVPPTAREVFGDGWLKTRAATIETTCRAEKVAKPVTPERLARRLRGMAGLSDVLKIMSADEVDGVTQVSSGQQKQARKFLGRIEARVDKHDAFRGGLLLIDEDRHERSLFPTSEGLREALENFPERILLKRM